MELNIGNKTITSVDFSDVESAWRIEDAILVLEYMGDENKIVLGGDILTNELVHNYDSWYYNMESNQSYQLNVECSIKLAYEYITHYVEMNGNAFYVVFVVT